MPPPQWHQREIKRQLSRYEKSSLTAYHTRGRALVLPGSPGTEVEELMDVGYASEHIHGVEVDPDISEALYDHYWDLSPMHYGEVGEWLRNARGQFSYVHFDYMGHFKHDELTSVQGATNKLAPIARVRVSTMRVRKGETQVDFEDVLRRRLLTALVEQAAQGDLDGRRIWHEALRAIESQADDTTQITAATIVLNHFFGLNVWDYTDSAATGTTMGLPEVKGTHCIGDIRRFSYYEAEPGSRMFTTWVDLYPRANTGLRYGDWVMEEMAKIIKLLTVPVSNFNPEHFQET